MKKILSIILSLLIICSISPLSAIQVSAETYSGTCGENITWEFDNVTGTLTISGMGDMECWNSSSYSPWYKHRNSIKFVGIANSVTSIGDYAFYSCISLTEITIPNSIKSIGYSAFGGCTSLTEIIIPDSVTSIGEYVFGSCTSLTSITIPDSITSISAQAFSNCTSLTEIIIPNTVTSIGLYAFSGCTNLTEIIIPDGVKRIGTRAFEDCTSLTKIIIPNTVTSIDERAFNYCTSLNEITIPDSVTYIGDHAFNGCTRLTRINITDLSAWCEIEISDDYYNSNRFFSSPLYYAGNLYLNGKIVTNFVIPDDITKIKACTFSGCTSLASITIPNSVTSIGYCAFYDCSNLSDVYFVGTEEEWNNIYIDNGNANLTSAIIHFLDIKEKSTSGVIRSGDNYSINWKCLYKEDNDGNILDANLLIYATGTAENEDLYIYMADGSAFPWETEPHTNLKSAIENISIQGTSNINLRVATNSFKSYEKLEGLELDYVSGVDSNSFTDCPNLTLVDIKDNNTFISYGSNVFKNCTELKNVSFPNSLRYINAGAFKNTALGTITLDGELAEIKDGAFAYCTNIKIRCYEDSVAHRFAVSNNIPYELISLYPNSSKIYYYDGDVKKEEMFLYNLEDYVSETNSGTYSPKLAHMLAAMSASAYKSASGYEEPVLESLKSLGFEKTYKKYASNSVIDYSFGKMQMKNGQNLILVTIKGTGNIFDFEHWEQWGSNFTLGTDALFGASLHEGFSEAMEIVYADLLKFLNNDINNTVFVMTGHSRGAAVSNLLAVNLTNVGVSKSNIYSYNFACPDVASASGYDWNPNNKFSNIFNIGHAGDIVPVMPGKIGNIVGASSSLFYQWGKFGRSYWWAFDWTDAGELAYDFTFAPHSMTLYLQYMRREYSLDLYKEWLETQFSWLFPLGRLLNIACPVDVEVKNSNGKLIASVIDGMANYYDSEYGDVVILTDGNHKMIYIKGNEEISVNLLGTDEGTMTFSMAIIDDNGNIVSQKAFEKVSLTKNKKMTSTIPSTPNGEKADVSSVALYVLGNDGIAEKEVLADGKGTEILLNISSVKPDNYANKENDVVLDNSNTINSDNETTSPQTGDNSNIVLWLALFFVSSTSIISIIAFEKCKKCK